MGFSMEIDITDFFKNAAPMDYSASVAEIGHDAGPATWRAANEDSADYPIIDTDEKREAFRSFVRSAGAWSDDEINAWSNSELNALAMQWISGDMREVPGIDMGADMSDADWKRYQKMSEAGTVSGSLFKGADGRIYWQIEG